MGNLAPIQESWPAYAAIFRMPLVWASATWTASLRRASTTSRSCLNMSGCWSYLLEMYCLMAAERARGADWRKGRQRRLLVGVSTNAYHRDGQEQGTPDGANSRLGRAPTWPWFCCAVSAMVYLSAIYRVPGPSHNLPALTGRSGARGGDDFIRHGAPAVPQPPPRSRPAGSTRDGGRLLLAKSRREVLRHAGRRSSAARHCAACGASCCREWARGCAYYYCT